MGSGHGKVADVGELQGIVEEEVDVVIDFFYAYMVPLFRLKSYFRGLHDFYSDSCKLRRLMCGPMQSIGNIHR